VLVPAAIAPAAQPARVWVPGHWEWQGNGHAWVPGYFALGVREAARERDHRDPRGEPGDLDRGLAR
jgi:hypothetical protein